ncbi:hypothetical protein D3C85_1853930 [compost metagenome]
MHSKQRMGSVAEGEMTWLNFPLLYAKEVLKTSWEATTWLTARCNRSVFSFPTIDTFIAMV